MKILYIFRSLAVWGGIERIFVDKINWLETKGGSDVYMITTDQGEHPIPYRLNEKVHVIDLKINFHRQYKYDVFRRLRIAFQMRQKFKRLLSNHIHRIRPDIIICTTADQIEIISKLKGKTPLIVESHSICNRTIEHRKSLLQKYHRLIFLKSLSMVDCVVSLTAGDAVEWQRLHHMVKIIPNMLHPCKSERSSLTTKRVIWVGRFDYQKRVELAVRIWELVVYKYPDWCLDIYGDGEICSEIKTMASLVHNVFVHQPTAKIFDCYRDSSILMSTSLFEPFGLVIIEAMSCGLPVVAFDCPYGPADIITDGEDGFLVPYDNMQYYADKLCLLIEDHSILERMGKAAFASSKRYEADRIMPKWKALFNELIKKR